MFWGKGTVQGMVYRITYPRSDLKVKVNEFSVAPGLALTSWIGILFMGNEAMMMGDLVLLDTEEASAVAKLVARAYPLPPYTTISPMKKPAIKYIHFSGSGNLFNWQPSSSLFCHYRYSTCPSDGADP